MLPLTPAGILVVSRPRGVPPLQLEFHGIYEVLLSLFQADTQSFSLWPGKTAMSDSATLRNSWSIAFSSCRHPAWA